MTETSLRWEWIDVFLSQFGLSLMCFIYERGGCSEGKQPFRTLIKGLFFDVLDYSNTVPHRRSLSFVGFQPTLHHSAARDFATL